MPEKNSRIGHIKRTAATLLLTLTFIVSGAAAYADDAASTNDAAGSSIAGTTAQTPLFSDVKSGFWAEKHIYKLASEGIILGDNGQFRPNDPVTQQEVIKLAISFMNISGKLDDSAKPPEGLQATAYFQPYVALAVKEKLIDSAEEIAGTVSNGTWGTQNASREWLAKILVRALGKEADAKAEAGKGTTFVDNSTISAADRGYVNVALDLGITNGVEGNRFDPLGTVTRAQAATFFSRGQEFINPGYANVYEGVVTSIGDGKLSLYTNGQNRSFTLDNRTAYFSKDSETRAAQTDVAAYSKAMVIDKVGSAAYVEITDPTPQLQSVEGTLLRVLPDNKLLLLVGDEPQTYTYDAATSFMDQNGNTVKAADLTNESTVELKQETYSADHKIVIVKVTSGIVNKSSSGTVQAVDTATKTITVQEASGNVDKLVLDGTVKILYQGEVMNLADLKPGSVISYTIKDNSVVSVEVTQSVERTVTGSLISLSGGKLLTYQKADGTYGTLPLAEQPQVLVDGIATATLSDLIADENGGDQVELTLNGDGVITAIKVLNRQSEQLSEVSVVQYDKTRKLLTVVDSNDNPYVLTLDADTKVEYNSTSPTLAGLESLLNSDRKVTITHIGKRVLSISVIYQYEGSFVSADTVNKKLKLQTADGKTLELAYNTSSLPVYIFGKASGTVADLKAGAAVTVQLDNSQNFAQSVSVKTVKQFEIVSVDTSAKRVTAKADGTTQSFYVDKATLLNATGGAISVSDLKAGDYINVMFNGTAATSVQTVSTTYGAVTNATASAITLKGVNGAASTIPAAGSVKVIRGTQVSTSLATLTTSDHVAVRKDADGSTLVTVLSSLNRSYWRYDSAAKDVYVKKETLSDTNNRFSLPSDAYIHQGDTTLTVQSLVENDTIVLYFDGDKLVEIEKQ